MTNKVAIQLVNVRTLKIVKLLTFEAEDRVAPDHADMDAFAVEYIAVHDRPPIEVPHGKGCACWAAIARQIALGLFPLLLQPQLDERWIKSVCESSQSFSMEASVCLLCGVPQKWSGLEPWSIVSTLFALRTTARSSLSCSGVQGARGIPVISASPSASIW